MIRKIINIFLPCLILFQFHVHGQSMDTIGLTVDGAMPPSASTTTTIIAPSDSPSDSSSDNKDKNTEIEEAETPIICSTSNLTVMNKTFVHIWKVNSFMKSLKFYEDMNRLLEIETNQITFKDDIIKGKWTFKITNTKVHGIVAVYAHYSTDKQGINDTIKYFKLSLKYSSKKYRGASYYESNILEAIDQTTEEILNSPTNTNSIPISTSSHKRDRKRNHDTERPQHSEYADIKYPMEVTAMIKETNNFIFEFPTFEIVSRRKEHSSKITEAEFIKLHFTIQAFYQEVVKEPTSTNSCKQVESSKK